MTMADPYTLLGIGALLFQIDTSENIALMAASAIAAALRVDFGAVVLRGPDASRLRLFGQPNQFPLDAALKAEIENLVGPGRTPRGQGSQEIQVEPQSMPGAFAAGLRRLLVAPVRTVHEDFGLAIAGGVRNGSYGSHEHICLEALAGQIAVSLQRCRLDEQRAAQEEVLKQATQELEVRVQERTAELLQANERLQQVGRLLSSRQRDCALMCMCR